MKRKSILSFLVVLLMVTNLAISQKNVEVPFYTKGPLMYVDVELGGKYCTFLFDTGASSSSSISIAFAKELGLNLDKETNVRSFGGVQKAYDVVIPELKLGAYIRQNVKAMAIPNITSGFYSNQGCHYKREKQTKYSRVSLQKGVAQWVGSLVSSYISSLMNGEKL